MYMQHLKQLLILITMFYFSCDSLEVNGQNILKSSNDTQGISLKRNGESLIQPFQKLKSLDSSFVYYKSHFSYPEVFNKYKDTSKYQLYSLNYEDIKNLYWKTDEEIGADFFLLVDTRSKKIVGILARWAFYIEPNEQVSDSSISFVKANFFPDLEVDIKADKNWLHRNESEMFNEYIRFIDFEKMPSGDLALPVIEYLVEF